MGEIKLTETADAIMAERKLIQFGKSAFCMTIPHTWLEKNHLKKGDAISIVETLRNSLEIMPTNGHSKEIQELTIDITGKTTDEIVQLLLSTYLNGYSIITLVGPNAGKVAFVRKHVHEFIAAEIMEVTANKIVIHVFFDIKTIDLNSIIQRIGHITKSLFSETLELIDTESDGEASDSDSGIRDLLEKGLEVQRQVLLARRTIKYALNNSAAAHKFNLSSLELLYVSYIIYFFGMIGDYVVKLATIIDSAKIHKFKTLLSDINAKKDLKTLLERTMSYYGKVLDAYNKHDKLVKFVFSEYADFEESIETFRKKNLQLWAPLLAEYLKLLIYKIKEVELNMISMENAPK